MNKLFFLVLLNMSSSGILKLSAQVHQQFIVFSRNGLDVVREKIPTKFYEHFQSLINNRDTVKLYHNIDSSNALIIQIEEGYDFKLKNYMVNEKYILNDTLTRLNKSRTIIKYRNNNRLNNSFCSNADTSLFVFKTSRIIVDTIFPRKYFYGTGCVVTKSKFRKMKRVQRKADKDGIIIENYCKILTTIIPERKLTQTIYYFPAEGKREASITIGWMSWGNGKLENWMRD